MKLLLFWKPFIWLALICYGLFLPANELPVQPFLKIPHFDKIVHFGLFFGLCLFLFRPFKRLNTQYYFWAPAVSLFAGAVLETTQHLVSHTRSSNLYDFVANAAGVGASLVFYAFFVSGKKWEELF
ncbi:MAG: VanZ family protein [bacterium]